MDSIPAGERSSETLESGLPPEAAEETAEAQVTRRSSYGRWYPLCDMKETTREVVVYVDLPGVDEDDVHIEIETDTVCVHGEREFNHDIEDAEEYVRLERPYGPFSVAIPLNFHVVAAEAKAKYKRGVLTVRIPKCTGPSKHGVPVALQ